MRFQHISKQVVTLVLVAIAGGVLGMVSVGFAETEDWQTILSQARGQTQRGYNL